MARDVRRSFARDSPRGSVSDRRLIYAVNGTPAGRPTDDDGVLALLLGQLLLGVVLLLERCFYVGNFVRMHEMDAATTPAGSCQSTAARTSGTGYLADLVKLGAAALVEVEA